MKKKVLIWTAVALGSGLFFYLLVLRTGPPSYEYRFDKVTRGDLSASVVTTGTLTPVISVDVGTQVSGIISNLYADFNSEVKKGQVIARIDTTLLWQSVKDAQAALEGAKAKADDSRKILIREKALVDRGLDSQANYDSAMTADESNQQSLLQAVSALDMAKINLGYATIRAPVSGVVINRAVNIGETVAASYSSPVLYTIADDLTKMQVLTTVDESDIGMISVGQAATFTVEAYSDRKFNGIVTQIRLAPVSIQNVVNYTVVIDVDNSDLKLMPGMTADVTVGVASAHDVLKVPNLALRFQPLPELIDSSKIPRPTQGQPGQKGAWADRFASGSVNSDGSGPSQGDSSATMGVSAKPQFVHVNSYSMRDTAYGLKNLYPLFDRPSYEVKHQGGRGRIWVLNAQNKLEPVFVRTGVTDGRFTEVTGEGLNAGEQVVLSAEGVGFVSGNSSLLAGGAQRLGGGFR